ncbi:MAG: hypothetical protein IBJ07_15280 [Rhizobiaceae bacterium]|jgi:hypothetical protein|nr:hypothetical protein [Rhizobiaceae bacterium]
MEHIAAILLMIGCSGDLAQCEEVPAPVFAYETVEECRSDLPSVRSAAEGSHPKMFAECITVDPLLVEADAELVWDIEDGKLVASLEPWVEPSMAVAMAFGDPVTNRQE